MAGYRGQTGWLSAQGKTELSSIGTTAASSTGPITGKQGKKWLAGKIPSSDLAPAGKVVGGINGRGAEELHPRKTSAAVRGPTLT